MPPITFIKKKMTEPTLNIEYHIKRLILIALGKYKTDEQAAKALGVARRTLYNYKKKYHL